MYRGGQCSAVASRSIPASAVQSHQFSSTAQVATVLDKVAAICARSAFRDLHRHLTLNAGEQIDQRAFIVIGVAHEQPPLDGLTLIQRSVADHHLI
jgi:hypothetical protein